MAKIVEKSLLSVGNNNYKYYSIVEYAKKINADISKLPFSLKILLENMLRFYDDENLISKELLNDRQIKWNKKWIKNKRRKRIR